MIGDDIRWKVRLEARSLKLWGARTIHLNWLIYLTLILRLNEITVDADSAAVRSLFHLKLLSESSDCVSAVTSGLETAANGHRHIDPLLS